MTHWKTMQRLAITLVLVVLPIVVAQSIAGQVLAGLLAERLRQSDVIAVAEVRNLKAENTTERFGRETKTYQRSRQDQFEDAGLAQLDKLLHQHRIGA